MANIKVIVFSSLLLASFASPTLMDSQEFVEMKAEFDKLQALKEKIVPMPMHQYKDDCGTDANLRINSAAASLLQQHNVPGAGVTGMDKFKPFEKVHKDGYLLLDCVKDYMYYRGDKFGDNKHDYKLGPVSDVSIVHYDAFVAKEDRAEMTHKKCFEFCRTVPNMGFFGIVNGRGCYCTPYFTPMESDSRQCDAVCEGDNTLMCGGQEKSSVFAMHMCDSTADDLGTRSETAKEMKKNLGLSAQDATKQSKAMQGFAVQLQQSFGQVGDSSATGLAQDAKVYAGTLIHKAEDAEAVAGKLDALIKTASSLKTFNNPETVTKAERTMEGIDEDVAEGEAVAEELFNLRSLAAGTAITEEGSTSKVQSVSTPRVVWTKRGTDAYSGYWNKHQKSPDVDVQCLGSGCGFKAGKDGTEQIGVELTEQCSKCVHGLMMPLNSFAEWQDFFKRIKFVEERPPQEKEEGKAVKQYYPVMYFVDKEFESLPTTCSGGRVAKPIVGGSSNDCAKACDDNIHSCVGFQYFEDGDKKLCFLLSEFSTGSYYTGCGKSFLQANAAPFKAQCFAKLSKFSGTTLKPNPSGKCAQCFKELTKANRCFK